MFLKDCCFRRFFEVYDLIPWIKSFCLDNLISLWLCIAISLRDPLEILLLILNEFKQIMNRVMTAGGLEVN